MRYLWAFLFSGLFSWAYITPPDQVILDGRIVLTSSRPLNTYPWRGDPPRLSEHPGEGFSDARELEALWEIKDGRLFLLAVSGFRLDGFAQRRSVGLRDLMPERMQDGRVFADWYRGEFSIFERARTDPRLSLRGESDVPFRLVARTFKVTEGVVEELPKPAEPLTR